MYPRMAMQAVVLLVTVLSQSAMGVDWNKDTHVFRAVQDNIPEECLSHFKAIARSVTFCNIYKLRVYGLDLIRKNRSVTYSPSV